MECLSQFCHEIINSFQPFLLLLPDVSIDMIIYELQEKSSASYQAIPGILQPLLNNPNAVLKRENFISTRICLECLLLFCRECFECIIEVFEYFATIAIRCLVFNDRSIQKLVIRTFFYAS